jgi:hypothetical protein
MHFFASFRQSGEWASELNSSTTDLNADITVNEHMPTMETNVNENVSVKRELQKNELEKAVDVETTEVNVAKCNAESINTSDTAFETEQKNYTDTIKQASDVSSKCISIEPSDNPECDLLHAETTTSVNVMQTADVGTKGAVSCMASDVVPNQTGKQA